jgi:hypothetical protein
MDCGIDEDTSLDTAQNSDDSQSLLVELLSSLLFVLLLHGRKQKNTHLSRHAWPQEPTRKINQ